MLRRLTLTTAALAALLAGGSAHAQVPPLAASVSACETGPDPADRFAEFSASMPREGAAIMGMRFVLYEKLPGGRFVRVSLPNWEEWERTGKAKVPGFVFTKRVEELATPASFKAIVTFRWYDDEGGVLRTTRRTTEVCKQPDWRPDLVIDRAVFTSDGRARVTVANRGRTAAAPFRVTMGVADSLSSALATPLAAGERRTLTMARCRGPEQAVFTVDAAGAVDEADEGDNVLVVACPTDRP